MLKCLRTENLSTVNHSLEYFPDWTFDSNFIDAAENTAFLFCLSGSSEQQSDLITKNKGNPSELWKTFNEITSKKSNSTITSIEVDGVLHTETNKIAQTLNTHFSCIGTKLAAKIKEKLRLITSNSRKFFPPAFSRWNGNNKAFSFCSITESFVLKQLKTLKTNKAIGLDRISARLLKDSADCMAPILTRLFNRSLEASTFPSIWKCGKVTAFIQRRRSYRL